MNPILEKLLLYPSERKAKLFDGIRPKDIIDLSIGEPKHAPDPDVIEVLNRFAVESVGKYPTTVAIPDLSIAFVNWAKRELAVDISAKQTQVLCGSGEGLFSIPSVCVSPEKPIVLIPNPFYQVYEGATLLAHGTPYFYDLRPENNFQPDFDSIPEDIFKKTALIYINYPNNPCAVNATEETLKRTIELSQRYDFTVASDESYFDLWFETPQASMLKVASDLNLKNFDKIVAFHTLSKRSSLPGLRSGVMLGDEKIINKYLRVRFMERKVMPVNAQYASALAWNDPKNYRIANRLLYYKKRNQFVEALKPFGAVKIPESTFYVWWEVPKKFETAEQFAKELYAATGIGVYPGAYFSKANAEGKSLFDRYVRFALIENENRTTEAVNRIIEFLKR